MTISLKEQTAVITGASSGIGRETALKFASRGAAVVLAARNKKALEDVAEQIQKQGGRAHVVATDVSEWKDVRRLAQEAVNWFGRIDTWVNNAAVSEYATVEQMTVEEIERIVRVNLMGQIHGMKAALEPMKKQGGGTIINVASVLAERSVPYQAAYCATKHGIKGFTEALRLELEHEKSNIHVTLILPASINTPLFEHARSKIGALPKPIPPIYQPEVVANAIVFAAERPRRTIVAGGAGKVMEVLERINPALLDWYMLRGGRMFKNQKANRPDNRRDNLFKPSPGKESAIGSFGRQSKPRSFYTSFFELHPERKLFLGAGVLALLLLRNRNGKANGRFQKGRTSAGSRLSQLIGGKR